MMQMYFQTFKRVLLGMLEKPMCYYWFLFAL